MSEPTLRCPKCSSPLKQHSAYASNANGIEAAFKCSNASCGSMLTGQLVMGSGLPKGTLAFSTQASPDYEFAAAPKEWIAVDLDGTLAEQKIGSSAIGKPIDAMVKRIKGWRNQGYEVRIFTTRAADAKGVKAVKAWLSDNNLPDLPVTNIKSPGLLELWDNRAIRVTSNSGQPCSGCKPSAAHSATPGMQAGFSIQTDC